MKFFQWIKGLFRKKQPKKIKIGLALGSGGAKGYAEIGIIKALEENNIEFDVIAGTSIGSVIGAFLADGYTYENILDILKRIDFNEIINPIMVNMDTSGMYKVLARELGYKNIEELKKPFMTIATNMDTDEGVVFSSGDVAKSLVASSCFPPFFRPVEINGSRFVDGAFVNSIPADLVKQMGADYIIAVDLATYNKKQSILTKIVPTYKGKVDKPWEIGYKNADIVLHPDLTKYSPVQFKKGKEMFDIGYKEGEKYISQILKDIENLKKNGRKKIKK